MEKTLHPKDIQYRLKKGTPPPLLNCDQVVRAKSLIKRATEEKKVGETTVAAAAIFKRKTLGTKLNML